MSPDPLLAGIGCGHKTRYNPVQVVSNNTQEVSLS